jgi:hypothetical protein
VVYPEGSLLSTGCVVYNEARRFGEALATAHWTTPGCDAAIVRIFNTLDQDAPETRSARSPPSYVKPSAGTLSP